MIGRIWYYLTLDSAEQTKKLPDFIVDTRSCEEQIEYELKVRQEKDLFHYRQARIKHDRENVPNIR